MTATYTHVVTTKDEAPALREVIRKLPAILAGKVADIAGIAAGFKSRIGYTLLGLVAKNFDDLSMGGVGADGTKWHPLSKAYLAYGRRFGPTEKADLRKQAGVTKGMRYAPGDKKGLLTKDQLKLWRRTFADRFAWYVMREGDSKAKAHAAAVAWLVVKAAGGKTKLDVFGNRQVQILVDTGRGRGSLQPGTLAESVGPSAAYSLPAGKGGDQQLFDPSQPGKLIVGSNVKYMGAHHNAKNPKRQRRLWPETFPADWWSQILGAAVSGLTRITDLYHGSRGI